MTENDPSNAPLLPIDQAPPRVRREHYRRERRNSAIAVGVIVLVVGALGVAIRWIATR